MFRLGTPSVETQEDSPVPAAFLLQSFSSDLSNLSELRFLSEIALPSGWCPGDREVSAFEHADVGLRGLDSDPPRMFQLKLLEETLLEEEGSCGGENYMVCFFCWVSGWAQFCSFSCGFISIPGPVFS